MLNTLSQTAIASGAAIVPGRECEGGLQPPTYTMTLEQLHDVVATYSAQVLHEASKMLKATPLQGRIGDWYDTQMHADSVQECAELLISFGHEARPA